MDDSLGIRFWSKVKKTKTCWVWTAYKNPCGYGVYGKDWKKGNELAHRVAYAEKHGKIGKGIFILHKCDNPACVRPSHLFSGSQKDNMADAKNKGRIKNQNSYKKTCVRGHPLEGSHITINKKGSRVCLKCSRIWKQKYYRKITKTKAEYRPRPIVHKENQLKSEMV